METTTFTGFRGTRLRVEFLGAYVGAWKQGVAGRMLAALEIDTSPNDDNSTGVSATGRRRR